MAQAWAARAASGHTGQGENAAGRLGKAGGQTTLDPIDHG